MTRQSTKNPASQSQNTTQITEFHIARDLKAAHLPLREDNVEPSEEGEGNSYLGGVGSYSPTSRRSFENAGNRVRFSRSR
jgi:hypothetical protein